MVARKRVVTKKVVLKKAAAVPALSNRKDWRWAEGVHAFPDAICPFCNVVMRSSCLWQFDEVRQKIVRVVEVGGSKLVNRPVMHPHRSSDGYVCMGSARSSVSQAMLLGINPSDCMGAFNWHGRVAKASRDFGAWPEFFARYFPDHVHLDKRRRARPRLFKAATKKAAA